MLRKGSSFLRNYNEFLSTRTRPILPVLTHELFRVAHLEKFSLHFLFISLSLFLLGESFLLLCLYASLDYKTISDFPRRSKRNKTHRSHFYKFLIKIAFTDITKTFTSKEVLRIKRFIDLCCLDVPLNSQSSHYKKCMTTRKENYNFALMTDKVH